MTADKLICAVESGKYEGATFVFGEEYIMESTFPAKLFIRVWFNHGRTTNGLSTRAFLWSDDRQRHLVVCISMSTSKWLDNDDYVIM